MDSTYGESDFSANKLNDIEISSTSDLDEIFNAYTQKLIHHFKQKEIEKRKTNEFLGNENRNKFLNAIRDSMNEFLISKEEDPIIFNAVFKTFVIKQG